MYEHGMSNIQSKTAIYDVHMSNNKQQHRIICHFLKGAY